MYISPDISRQIVPDGVGQQQDLSLLEEDRWLMDTEVCYLLQERKSQWHLTMVYVAIDNPFKLICKKIDTYPSERKARTFAELFQRGIRKDARGVLKKNENAFHICTN
ncbi:MAG: hypothetical protein AAF798_05435 [Bacteroidota bacterium]